MLTGLNQSILQPYHLELSCNVRKRSFAHFHPAKIQIAFRGHILTRIVTGAFWTANNAKFLHANKAKRPDCTDAQADLSLSLGAYVRKYVFCRCGSKVCLRYPVSSKTSHVLTNVSELDFLLVPTQSTLQANHRRKNICMPPLYLVHTGKASATP